MAGRPPLPPRHWAVVRASQPSYSERQFLVRAYELVLPIVRANPLDKAKPNPLTMLQSRRRHSPVLVGA
jgi:hypothetical protein